MRHETLRHRGLVFSPGRPGLCQRRHRSGTSKQPGRHPRLGVPGTCGNARHRQTHPPDSKHRPHSGHNSVADARRRGRGADAHADLSSSPHGYPRAHRYPYAGTGSDANPYAGTDSGADSYRGTDPSSDPNTGALADANNHAHAPSHRDARSHNPPEANG